MESAPSFSLPDMMQRILQHPAATFSAMAEGREKIHVSMPVASVERFRGTLETVKRELEQTDPQTNIVIFCPSDEEMGRLTEALGHLGERLTLVKGRLSGGFEMKAGSATTCSDRINPPNDPPSAAACRLPPAACCPPTLHSTAPFPHRWDKK